MKFTTITFGALAVAAVLAASPAAAADRDAPQLCGGPQSLSDIVPTWKPQLIELSRSLLETLRTEGRANPRAVRRLFTASPHGGLRPLQGAIRQPGMLAASAFAGVEPGPELRLIGLVAGDRGDAARSVWAVGDTGVVQTLDLRKDRYSRWLIYRVAITRADAAPALPERFCGASELTPLW